MQDRREFIQTVIAATKVIHEISYPMPELGPKINQHTGWKPKWPMDEEWVYWPYIGKLKAASAYSVQENQIVVALSYLYDPGYSIVDMRRPQVYQTVEDYSATMLTITLKEWVTCTGFVSQEVEARTPAKERGMAFEILLETMMPQLKAFVLKKEMRIVA